VDISFSSDSGLKSARYMLERMEALPPLRPLILVFKYFLVSGREGGREGGRAGHKNPSMVKRREKRDKWEIMGSFMPPCDRPFPPPSLLPSLPTRRPSGS